jgi:predicted PurR-regulated permease PerM
MDLISVLKPISLVMAGFLVGPLGAQFAPLIVGGIAEQFGLAPDAPEAQVVAEIQANPEKAAQAVIQVEQKYSQAMSDLQAHLADVQDARQTMLKLAQSGSLISWFPAVLSTTVVVSFIGVVLTVILKGAPDNNVSMMLLGALGAAFTGVMNYWFSSSAGSKSKDALIAGRMPPEQIINSVAGAIKKAVK